MTQQYDRQCSLIVGDQSGNGIELSELQVKFTVHKGDVRTPAYADIRVYNLSVETAKKIVQQEYTHVFLQAGYPGNIGLIFSGSVRQFRRGRESATDTYLDILAQDGDVGYNFAVMGAHNGTGSLAAGWTQDQLLQNVLKAFDPYGIKTGFVPQFGAPAMPRGKVCYGMARDEMQTLADAAGTSWHISNGMLNMIPISSTLPGEAIELNSGTGMVGMPQQTINGITVRCLINPKIKFGGKIKLNNSDIQLAQNSVAYSAVNYFPSLDADGEYKVCAITMMGNTRGQEWYMDMITVGVNGTAPLSGPYINAVVSGNGF